MKITIQSLTATVAKLENKCEDLKARSRPNNIRIHGVPKIPNTATTAAIVALLKELFSLDKDPVHDHSHRVPLSRPKDATKTCPIVIRLHYYSYCVYILQWAKAQRQLKVRG